MDETVLNVVNGLIFVAWIWCVVVWIKRGCPVPRWLHVSAIVMLLAGIAVTVACAMADVLSTKRAIYCILVPPFAVYTGWLWMFGPEHDKRHTEDKTQNN